MEKNEFIFDSEIAPKEFQVKRTKNYTQFKTITGNRTVNMGHVNNLVKMIAKNNLLPHFIGVVTKDGFLVDGQHRLKAAEANNLWFYFTVIPESVDDIIVSLVNSVQLRWTVDDYVNFFADRGQVQYAWIRELHNNHKISNSSLIAMFKGGTTIKDLRNGTLVLFTTSDEEQYLLALLEGYLELKDSLDRRVWTDQDFIKALRKIFQQANSKELIVAIERWGKIIPAQDHDRDYLRVFEEVLNKGKQEKNFYRFF
jgi:hypothetical protein